MGIESRGKIYAIMDAKQITERFRKREFVIELADNPQYPQHVLFQLTGDRCENLDAFSVGDEVTVEFSLRGREWTSPTNEVKYFNSLDVWTIEKAGASASSGPPAGFDEGPPPGDPPPDLDDIPF
jgi:hypothetical protein